MKYLANLNKNHLVSFLVLTIGSLILGTEDRSNISNHYYITDRAFTIKQGGVIHVDYGVKQNDSYLSGGLEPVAVEFSGHASTDGIVFGNLEHTNYLTDITYSAWYKAKSGNFWGEAIISHNDGDAIGSDAFSVGTGFIHFTNWRWSTTDGIWYRNFSPTIGSLYHVAMTYNYSTASIPKFYINGVEYAPTTSQQPTGTLFTKRPQILIVGNKNTNNFQFTNGVNGSLFDVRMYNRIITAAEVTTLYNGGVPDTSLVTDGLVFQGLATYADRPLSAGHVLTSSDRLTENIIRAVGVPNGSPTIRANP